jgi:fructokinase
VVVITSSADGASAYTVQGGSVRRPALDVAVVDTVGAGDSFTAGLLGSLLSGDRYTPTDLARCPADELSGALDDAILVASLNCERRGNDPPTAADVEAGRKRLKPI